MSKPKKRVKIPKQELRRLLKQGKKREAIAKRYRVSKSRLDRLIRRYRLNRFVKKGRRPLPRKPHEVKPKRLAGTWVPVKNYIEHLDREYGFVNATRPPARFVNQRTLVCSNWKRNPTGRFTTVGIYSVVYVSNVYFLFSTSIRYSRDPRPFKEVYSWISAKAPSILEEQYHGAYYVVRIVALTFHRTKGKPKEVRYD